MLLADARDEQAEVVDQAVEAVDQRAAAVGAAVAAVVERVDGVALAQQPLGDVRVAAAVLGGAVDEDHGARAGTVRLPRLPVQARAVGRAEPAVAGHAATSVERVAGERQHLVEALAQALDEVLDVGDRRARRR